MSYSSLEESPLKSTVGSDATETKEEMQSSGLSVKALKSIDIELVKRLLAKKSLAQAQVQTSFAESAIKPGIYKDDGKTYFVCPELLFEEDCSIGQMLVDLCLLHGIEIKMVPSTMTLTSVYNEQFIIGLWFGTFTSTILRRRKAKQTYELGRTCMHALCVKNAFEQDESLGADALVRDQFYFGNNPGEIVDGTKDTKQIFKVKNTLISYFSDPEFGNTFYGMLNHIASLVKINNLTEAERDKVISENLNPVDSLITSFYPTVTVKKGRKESIEKRKPNPIRSSPLFLKEEMELITSMTSSIFKDLGMLSSTYEESVLSQGYASVKKQIKDTITARWETLQRFAHVTKERLQDIRKYIKDDKIRKAKVVKDNVHTFLKQQIDAPARLIDELRHIMGRTSLAEAYSYAFQKKVTSNETARNLLYIKSINLYQKIDDLKGIKYFAPKEEFKQPEEIDFDKAIKAVLECERKSAAVIRQMKNAAWQKDFKIWGRTDQIMNLSVSLANCFEALAKLDNFSVNLAISMYFDEKIKTGPEYLLRVSDKVLKEARIVRLASESRLIITKDEDLQKVIRRLITSLEVLESDLTPRGKRKDSDI